MKTLQYDVWMQFRALNGHRLCWNATEENVDADGRRLIVFYLLSVAFSFLRTEEAFLQIHFPFSQICVYWNCIFDQLHQCIGSVCFPKYSFQPRSWYFLQALFDQLQVKSRDVCYGGRFSNILKNVLQFQRCYAFSEWFFHSTRSSYS